MRALTALPGPPRASRAADAVRRGVRGILGGVGALALLEASMQRQAKLARTCCQSATDGIDPAGCGERIECRRQVLKRAPLRVHG